MRKLFIIPFLFIAINSFAQTDSALGIRGEKIPLPNLSILSTYLIAPTTSSLMFDSSKVGVSLTKNATHDSIQLISGSGSVLATVKDSIGGGTSDSTFLRITANSLGTTRNDAKGIALMNYTAAAAGAQQISPQMIWTGQGWKTGGTPASQTVDVIADVLPVQGSTALGYLRFGMRVAGGAVTENILTIGTTPAASGAVGINTAPASGVALNISGGINTTGAVNVAGANIAQWFGNLVVSAAGSSPNGVLILANSSAMGTVATPKKLAVGTTSAASTCALVDLISTTSGLLLPRMTKTQRDAISTPVAGLAVYQTDNTPGVRVYNGTNWMRYTETTD